MNISSDDQQQGEGSLWERIPQTMRRHAERVLARFQNVDPHTGPFGWSLGIKYTERAPGQSVCVMEVDESHFNPGGVAHGGVVFSLLDSAMGAAVFTMLPPEQRCVTVELKVNYLRPIRPGLLQASGTVMQHGSTLAVVTGEARDGAGQLVALGNGTFAIIQRR
ncbi:MAG: hypothetical protein NVS4B8_02360 [Herpetosiphon sp.]